MLLVGMYRQTSSHNNTWGDVWRQTARQEEALWLAQGGEIIRRSNWDDRVVSVRPQTLYR